MEAKWAGDALNRAKEEGKRAGEIPHGQFRAWVETNTGVSYRTGAKYMQVAKVAAKSADLGISAGGVDALLDAPADQKVEADARADTPAFDTTDAEHVLTILALAEGDAGVKLSPPTAAT